jgi:protein involved in sex pheromone biosynthesis
MKKDISIAVMATILILQLVGSTVGGFIGDVADRLADSLSSRVQIERMLSEEGQW